MTDICILLIILWLFFELFLVPQSGQYTMDSKIYPVLGQSTEASYHIYFSQRPFTNVKAIVCA